VELDGTLGAAKPSPRKERQAQIDRRRIERIGRRVEVGGQRLVGIERPRSRDQHGGQVGVEAPVADFVCVGQGALGDAAAQARADALEAGTVME